MRRKLFKYFILALIAVIIPCCATESNIPFLIIGIWQTPILGGGTETHQFNPDGSLVDSSDTYSTQTGTWSLAGSILTITITIPPTAPVNYSISFSNSNTMIETPVVIGSSSTWSRVLNL
jgi:hypothetical protein